MSLDFRRLRLVTSGLAAAALAGAWTVWDAVRFKVPDAAALAAALGPLDAEPEAVRALLNDAKGAAPLGKPSRGDWLAEHPEPGQTFGEYAAQYPRQRRAGTRPVVLTWIGPRPDGWKREDAVLTRFLELLFQAPTKTLPAVPIAGIKSRESGGRRQLFAPAVLERLWPVVPPGAACLLALTAEDLYPKESWSYIFGLASFEGRTGVHSVARLDSPDPMVRLRRVLVVAGHEAGHAFGLRHCIYRRCLMNGFNNLGELDRKSPALCPICLRKLAWGAGVDLVRLHRDMAAYLASAGLHAEAEVYSRRL